MRKLLTVAGAALLLAACGTRTETTRDTTLPSEAGQTAETTTPPTNAGTTSEAQIAGALKALLTARPVSMTVEYDTPGYSISLRVDGNENYELIAVNDGAIVHVDGENYIKTDGVAGLENTWIHTGPETEGDFDPRTVVNDTIRDATGTDLEACLAGDYELTGSGDEWSLNCDDGELLIRTDGITILGLSSEGTVLSLYYSEQIIQAPEKYLSGQEALDAIDLIMQEGIKLALINTAEAYRRTASAITASDPTVTTERLMDALLDENISDKFNVKAEGAVLTISSEKCSIPVDFSAGEGILGDVACR